jgi:hypothetical protein
LKVLFYPLHATSFKKYLKIALAARETGLECIFLVTARRLHDQACELLDLNLEVWIEQINGHGTLEIRQVEDSRTLSNLGVYRRPEKQGLEAVVRDSSLFPKLKRFISTVFPKEVKNYLYFQRMQRRVEKEYANKLLQIKSFLNKVEPNKVVLCGDRHLQYEPVLISECVARHIPLVVPPVSVFDLPGQLAKQRANDIHGRYYIDGNYQCDLRGVFNGTETNSRAVSIYLPWVVNALSNMGILSQNPWVLGGSGHVDMLVSGDLPRDLLIASGVPEARVYVTGDFEFDELFACIENKELRRLELINKYHLDHKLRCVAVSLPQWLEHNFADEELHWSSIDHICSVVSTLNENVLISLHPKMNPTQYEPILAKYNLTRIMEPLADWLPICDVLIASQGSSTHLWAMITKIPILVIDWIGLQNDPFGISAGKTYVTEKEKLEGSVARLLGDAFMYDCLVNQQIKLRAGFIVDDNQLTLARIVKHLMR